jgi:hypothetical protein
MKKIILVALISTFYHLADATEQRVSFIFMHRSVGLEAVSGCFQEPYNRNIREVLDTMTVINDPDSARIVFRSYNLNYGVMGDTCLSDTVYYGDCRENYNNYFRGYDWELQEREKAIIYPPGVYSPMLTNVFQAPDRENQTFWNVFRQHVIELGPGVNVTERYDLVMVKNPYIVWRDPTQARIDALKSYYRALRDSVANNPEINFCFVLGTPLAFQTGGDDDFDGDTTRAKLMYNFARWFASDSFFTHSNSGPYRNVWKLDTYSPLCETSPDSSNRYCLRSQYWAGSSAQSHLSAMGALAMQDVMINFIRLATSEILSLRSGRPSRGEIDRKILDFREGRATESEVLELIEQYNNGG